MAIFGSAGSGKSIALQIKFIDAVQTVVYRTPLPIYFNLANGTDFKNIMNLMNIELNTNIRLQELKNEVHLYIDSFDEGIEMEKKRETLIKDYLTELKNCRAKILITCRSNYLESESNYIWFAPQTNELNKLATYYIAPMSYLASNSWRENVTRSILKNRTKR